MSLEWWEARMEEVLEEIAALVPADPARPTQAERDRALRWALSRSTELALLTAEMEATLRLACAGDDGVHGLPDAEEDVA